MKGYYVIGDGGDEPIEFVGKNAKYRALKKAEEIAKKGVKDVTVKQFNDDDPDGYFANSETIIVNY